MKALFNWITGGAFLPLVTPPPYTGSLPDESPPYSIIAILAMLGLLAAAGIRRRV